MSEKRILSINPELFSFSNNKTRKKREKNPDGKIKVKSPETTKRNDTLKKKAILKMIRAHQEDKIKNTLLNKTAEKAQSNSSGNIKNDFQEAKEFLEHLTMKVDEKKMDEKRKNNTLKNYSPSTMSFAQPPLILPEIQHPLIAAQINNPLPISSIKLNSSPTWGCLKGGTLPTYRSYLNQTRKNLPQQPPPISYGGVGGYSQTPTTNPLLHTQKAFSTIVETNKQEGGNPNNRVDTMNDIEKIKMEKINNSLSRIEQIKQTAAKLKTALPMRKKRRKTLRRTYKIGKSKVFPRVSVLVSNRTIRNNITTKTQNLKQTPIHDVKKYLTKRGLIKVGSMAPNDVLRKMYESAALICGDVQNHNSENLLFNYLNDKDDH